MSTQIRMAGGLLAFGLASGAIFWFIVSVLLAIFGQGESVWHYIGDLFLGRLSLHAFIKNVLLFFLSPAGSAQIALASLGFCFGAFIAGWKDRVRSYSVGSTSPALVPVPDKAVSLIKRAFPEVDLIPVMHTGLCRVLEILTIGVCEFFIVPQGFVLPVMAFGRYRSCRQPGLRQILSCWGTYEQPWEQLVPTVEQKEEFEVEGTTRDGIRCDVKAMFLFKIDDPGRALFEVAAFDTTMRRVAQGFLRDECGKKTMTELIQSRSEMAESARASLMAHTQRWGLVIPLFDVLEIAVRDRNAI